MKAKKQTKPKYKISKADRNRTLNQIAYYLSTKIDADIVICWRSKKTMGYTTSSNDVDKSIGILSRNLMMLINDFKGVKE